MFAFLTVKFLLLAFIGAIFSAISTSLLSVFISLKKISYMSEALSHISFTGIALAILLGMSVNLISCIFVLIVVLIIGLISMKYKLEESNVTMVILSVSMAIGILLISLRRDYTVDLTGYMFGNILLITYSDVIWLGVLILLNLIFLIVYFRDLLYLTYHFEISEFYHIPVKRVYFIFLILLAINIVISVKIVGIIMITAQLILPGMISLNLTKRIPLALLIGLLSSIFASVFGFVLSYQFNFPSGSVIVIILFIIFLFTLIKPLKFAKE